MKSRLVSATAALCLFACSAAYATPFKFTFTGSLTSEAGSLAGLANVGDVVKIDVIMDNGGSTTLGQTWSTVDTLSAALTVGAYSALYLDAFFPGSGFATDALGTLIATDWFGTENTLGASSDSFGVGDEVRLFNGAIREFGGSQSNYSPFLSGTLSAWSGPVPVSSGIPEPMSSALVALGLIGLASTRRRSSSLHPTH